MVNGIGQLLEGIKRKEESDNENYLEFSGPVDAKVSNQQESSGPPTSLQEVLEGRTKSPFSISELGEFLKFELEQDEGTKTRVVEDLEIGVEGNAESEVVRNWIDCVGFLDDYFKYRTLFFSLSPSLRSRSPDPFTIIQSLVSRQTPNLNNPTSPPSEKDLTSPTIFSPGRGEVWTIESLMRDRQIFVEHERDNPFLSEEERESLKDGNPQPSTTTWSQSLGLPSNPRNPPPPPQKSKPQSHISYSAFTISSLTESLPDGIDPKNQPLRENLKEIMNKWLKAEGKVGRWERFLRNGEVGRLVRLGWGEAKYTTHPTVLSPLVNHLISILDNSLLPSFLASESSLYNLSTLTRTFRLYFSILLFLSAVGMTILLTINPSPFGGGELSRGWRLVVGPIWGISVKWLIDSQTGVDFWLVYRRKREFDSKDLVGRRVIWIRRMGISFGFQKVEEDSGVLKRQKGKCKLLIGIWIVGTLLVQVQALAVGYLNLAGSN